MRTALVASLVSPIRAAEANGPHAVIVDLARGLTERGHRVTVYAAAGSVVDGVEVAEIPVEARAAGAQVSFDGGPDDQATAALNRGFALLFDRLRSDAPDAVSQHAFDAAAFELAEGMPVLHTLHLPPMDDAVVAAVRATRSPMATVSLASRDAWRRAGATGISVLRNGVPDYGLPGGPIVPVAIVAGRISPEKGTHIAIETGRRAGLAVLVAGDVYDSAYFARMVEPLLRPGEWIGPVPRDVLFQLLARCAVALLPARSDETFGLVAAEAQMAGCPVVGYRRGALPEVVPHAVGGWLVQPEDELALLAAVQMARRLDRRVIRARAQRDLGVDRMLDAYHEALVAIATGERRVTAAG